MNIKLLIKELLFWTPLRQYVFPSYRYNFSPRELSFLCRCLEETNDVNGSIIEIGCADGATTVFLNQFLDEIQPKSGPCKRYLAIDTFAGFVDADIHWEVSERHKPNSYFSGFQNNKFKWFKATMLRHQFLRVEGIQADINEFELMPLAPFSFVLLDVDLYRPITKALREAYELLSVGGIIIVDDCSDSDPRWDGAFQAYKEFMREIDQQEEVHFSQLGVVRKVT